MGNEESSMVDDSTRPSVLDARNIDAVAKYIKQRNVKRIVVMVGYTSQRTTRKKLTGSYRWARESVQRQAFQISGHQILDSMPIWPS